MNNWYDVLFLLPTLVVWFVHGYKIEVLEKHIAILNNKLHEATVGAFSANMAREIGQVLAKDDEARASQGLPPFKGSE